MAGLEAGLGAGLVPGLVPGSNEATLLHGLPGDAARFADLLALLRCPAGGEPFDWEPVAQNDPGLGVWGLLHGEGGPWPVLDTIPVFLDRVGAYGQSGQAPQAGPTRERLVSLIRAGCGREALIECLALPWIPGSNPRNEIRAKARGRLARRGIGLLGQLARRGPGQAVGRRLLERLLARPADAVTATELLWFFYGPGSPLPYEYLPYFLHRFTLPRTLAAAALLGAMPRTPRPVLDIACGFGHFAHLLTTGLGVTDRVVGCDLNFIPLWAARRTSARQAGFVVLDAGRPLPFATDAFGGAICSDAFVYIPEKRRLAGEMARVAGAHPLVFTRLGNRTALPHHGDEEFDAVEWTRVVGAPEWVWIASEDMLVKSYLDGETPDMCRPTDPGRLAHDKYLSVFLRPRGTPPPGPRPLRPLPHARGRLGLNPIFAGGPRPDGGLDLRAAFENPHFCLQNAGATAYLPLQAGIEPKTLDDIRAGRRTAAVEALIRTFVLIGLPERYAPDRLGIALAPDWGLPADAAADQAPAAAGLPAEPPKRRA